MSFRVPFVAAALLFAALPAAADDLTIVSKMTHDGAEATTATSYLSSDHARIVQPDGQEAILDLKTGQITVIDGRKKEYFVVTRQDMDQMKTRLQQAMNSPEMQRAQEQMKNLPPEMQKRMAGMMGAVAGSFEVKKTGTSRKVAGYNCDNWTITMGQFSKTEQCNSTEVPIPLQVWDTYRDFAESMRSSMAAMGPMGKGMTDIAAKMKEMRGYPLAVTTTTSIMGRSRSSSSEVVEMKKGSIPSSAWEVPAGYRKVDNPMLKAMPPGR
jgi:uncharacterized protein DUF4412